MTTDLALTHMGRVVTAQVEAYLGSAGVLAAVDGSGVVVGAEVLLEGFEGAVGRAVDRGLASLGELLGLEVVWGELL